MATIKDVAKLANVSVTTVSRVINNNGYVHEDTRKNITNAINELNYMPNIFSDGLSKENLNTIGIIINNVSTTTSSKLLEVIEYYCKKNNYKTIIAITRDSISFENYYYDLFSKYNVSGIIIVDVPSSISKFISLGKPIVSINNYINENISSVCVNNVNGAIQAVNELIQNNCRDVLIIKFTDDNDKVSSFIEQIELNNINYNILSISQINKEELYNFLLSNKFDSIYATSDLIAISIISLLQKMNISIPDDCCIIGYDNSTFSNIISPTLSTINYPVDILASKAFNLLQKHINNNDLNTIHEIIDIELIKRETTTKFKETE